MRLSVPALAVLFALAAAATTLASAGRAQDDAAKKIAALKDSIGANQARLRKYQWIQTTGLSVNGELEQTRVASCTQSGSAPELACTEMSAAPAGKPSGALLAKKKMAAPTVGLKALMDSVDTLIAQYLPPQKARIEAAIKAGKVVVAPNPSSGAVSLAISNYARQGDKVTIALGAAKFELREVSVSTWQVDPSHLVTLSVTYDNLTSGVDYVKKAALNMSGARKVAVTIITADYTRAP